MEAEGCWPEDHGDGAGSTARRLPLVVAGLREGEGVESAALSSSAAHRRDPRWNAELPGAWSIRWLWSLMMKTAAAAPSPTMRLRAGHPGAVHR